jgi:hypothetical protein
MPWSYFQRTGDIVHNGEYVGKGYSGYGGYCNRADFEHEKNQGPIPRGWYTIGHARNSPRLGSYSMNLIPVGHNAHGRTLFRIHGDSRAHPGGASTGCIILSLEIRKQIANSGDIDLQVI